MWRLQKEFSTESKHKMYHLRVVLSLISNKSAIIYFNVSLFLYVLTLCLLSIPLSLFPTPLHYSCSRFAANIREGHDSPSPLIATIHSLAKHSQCV